MVPIYLCAWHVLKAWRVHALEKIKDVVMRLAILDDLHAILYVMIDLCKNIKDFNAHGKKKVIVATPLWAKCEGEAHTPKSGNLESFKTPEN
jgi:hypothetical protein